MPVLPPVTEVQPYGQPSAQLQDLSQTVANERAFRGIVNVGVDDKGIGPHLFSRLGNQLVSRGDDQVVDAFDRVRAHLADIVANPSPVEQGQRA